jgi:hypothetical protein
VPHVLFLFTSMPHMLSLFTPASMFRFTIINLSLLYR